VSDLGEREQEWSEDLVENLCQNEVTLLRTHFLQAFNLISH